MRRGTPQRLWVPNSLVNTVLGKIHTCFTDRLVPVASLITSMLKPETSLMAPPVEAIKELDDQVVCMSISAVPRQRARVHDTIDCGVRPLSADVGSSCTIQRALRLTRASVQPQESTELGNSRSYPTTFRVFDR